MKLFKPRKIYVSQSNYGQVRSRVYIQKRKRKNGYFIEAAIKKNNKWQVISDFPILLDKDVQRATFDCLSQLHKHLSKV